MRAEAGPTAPIRLGARIATGILSHAGTATPLVGHPPPAAQPSPAASEWHAWVRAGATALAKCAACSCVVIPL